MFCERVERSGVPYVPWVNPQANEEDGHLGAFVQHPEKPLQTSRPTANFAHNGGTHSTAAPLWTPSPITVAPHQAHQVPVVQPHVSQQVVAQPSGSKSLVPERPVTQSPSFEHPMPKPQVPEAPSPNLRDFMAQIPAPVPEELKAHNTDQQQQAHYSVYQRNQVINSHHLNQYEYTGFQNRESDPKYILGRQLQQSYWNLYLQQQRFLGSYAVGVANPDSWFGYKAFAKRHAREVRRRDQQPSKRSYKYPPKDGFGESARNQAWKDTRRRKEKPVPAEDWQNEARCSIRTLLP